MKYLLNAEKLRQNVSLSARRAWIEISTAAAACASVAVALREEGVD